MSYSTIDIGAEAKNRASQGSTSNKSRVARNNPANATGVLTSFEVWLSTAITDDSLRVGTFTQTAGEVTKYTYNDYELIGDCSSGSKQTFTGKNCSVLSGDYIGLYFNSGAVEMDTSGGDDMYEKESTNVFASQSENTYTVSSGRVFSLYATGVTVPDAPTNVAATENDNSKVVITWTAGTGETTGHNVYRDGVKINGSAVQHNTNTYDDTTAGAPDSAIAAGTTSASKGTDADKVVLSVSGHHLNNGTQHTYTVKAINAAGESAASASDTGYRPVGASMTYQWQRSAGESDENYSDIADATTNPYNDTGAP